MLSKQEEKFIATASHYATLSPMLNHHGCVVVVNGQTVGSGYNNYRNYSRDKIISDCLSCHAEISAVRNAIKMEHNKRKQEAMLKKMKLYVVRLNEKGKYILDTKKTHPAVFSVNKKCKSLIRKAKIDLEYMLVRNIKHGSKSFFVYARSKTKLTVEAGVLLKKDGVKIYSVTGITKKI